MARYRRNLLTVGWVTVALGAPHLADHAGVVLSAFGLLFWDCHLAVEAGPRRGCTRLRLILTRPFDAGLQNACPACINAFRGGYPEALLGQEKLKRGL
ncbi:MAG: hypothetical protein K0R13_2355 [Propionibacteriaceae bacterium]|jgi:hypothetical protein|nr:hypothetical protein [Propionibacteriaceae bacterium]